LHGVQEVAGSNPVVPTKAFTIKSWRLFVFALSLTDSKGVPPSAGRQENTQNFLLLIR
jgi:hypothetical protein